MFAINLLYSARCEHRIVPAENGWRRSLLDLIYHILIDLSGCLNMDLNARPTRDHCRL
jgi:hypothetical protein